MNLLRRVTTLLEIPLTAFMASTLIFGGAPGAWAASHSDAPLIKQDPQANLTDVYAFIGYGYDDPSVKVLNVTMSFRPFSEPGDGARDRACGPVWIWPGGQCGG